VGSRCRLAGLVAVVGLVAAATLADARTLQVTRPQRDGEVRRLVDLKAGKWLNAPIKDTPSKREILRTRAEARQFPQALGGEPVVLRLCGIRVEFASVPDPGKISGAAGRFDLSDQRSTVFIDPSPHNRKFYLKHMESLANYVSAMSYGAVRIEWEIYPLANDSAYVLPDVGTYNPAGQVGTWDWENLEAFYRDAILTADLDDDLTFSDYDGFVIFHAGSDWQNDLRGDSPYDLPSFFISLAESISVDNGASFVFDGSVVPETSSQDGYLNGINGVLAHEVGHQLGLPDLYDTYTGLSVVGYWDLMDFGSGLGVVLADPNTEDLYYVTGIIPGPMSAWSKAYLGWIQPDTARSESAWSLRALTLQGEPTDRAVIVPLSSYEYFIVENRQCDLDGDSTGIVLSDPGPDSTGVIMGPVNQDREFNYEYDWPLPGSGLLVWRIDRVMVDFGAPYDAVNYFPSRRGVSIVEADGIPDLGDYNSYYFLGSPFDPFYDGNNDRLADDTYPNSRSTTGCHTHLVVDEISEPGNLMDFRVSYAWGKDGFPVALGDSLRFGVPSLLVADLDDEAGDPADEIEAALERGFYYTDTLGVQHLEYDRAEIYAFDYAAPGGLVAVQGWPRRLHGSRPGEIVGADLDGDGDTEAVVGDETGRIYAFTREGESYFGTADTLGAFVRLDEGINGVPVAHDIDGDGRDEILVGSFGLQVLESNPGDDAPEVWTLAPALSASQPLVLNFLVDEPGEEVVYYASGYLRVVSAGGRRLLDPIPVGAGESGWGVYLAAGDLDRAGASGEDGYEIIVAAADGRVWAFGADGGLLAGWGRTMCDGLAGPPALADINSDGYLEVLLTDVATATRALTWTGARVAGWPRPWYGCSLPTWDADFFIADTTIDVPSAVVVDLGCGEQPGVFQGSLYECIVGWGPEGDLRSGFPVSLGGGCSALAVGDIDGDGACDLVAGSGDGHVYGFSEPGCPGGMFSSPWRGAYFDGRRNCVFPTEDLPDLPEPGTSLLVAGSFHAFPNPVTSNTVTFVMKTETGGRADLEIFDLSGARVKAVSFDILAETESPVDVGDLANGLYLCRLEVSGDGRSVSEFFKIAIKR
jgi:M6 family metalloprotease-like protein